MVSEFMLQQTTVTTVVGYFQRWMAAFPTVRALAAADEEAVLSHWQGLGYYSRARNLHRAARAVVDDHRGKVPRCVETLRGLPGVGDYTAGAVAAFAYDVTVPVVDANIARVLARLENWTDPIDDAAGRKFLEKSAVALLPESGGRLHTSALMELGALICTARLPRCGECPVRSECRASDPTGLPVKRARPVVTQVTESRAFFQKNGMVWLERSSGPRWKGLWVLPEARMTQRAPDHVASYPITRYRVTLQVFFQPVPAGATAFSEKNLPPMPSPHRRAVAAMLEKGHNSSHVS